MPLIYTVLANLLMRVIGKFIREKGYNDVDKLRKETFTTCDDEEQRRNSKFLLRPFGF